MRPRRLTVILLVGWVVGFAGVGAAGALAGIDYDAPVVVIGMAHPLPQAEAKGRNASM